jgi:hypothetical protein
MYRYSVQMNIYDRVAENKQKIGPSNVVFCLSLFELSGKGIYHEGHEEGSERRGRGRGRTLIGANLR